MNFTKIPDNMLKKMMFLPLFLLLVLPAGAQERVDSVYEFRFVPKNDTFYVPYRNNLTELDRLSDFVEKHKDAILGGQIPLYVDGYANAAHDRADNLEIARIRSNRVKSELILRNGLTEACFITCNHAQRGEFVLVRAHIPAACCVKEAATQADVQTAEAKTIEPIAEATTRPAEEEVSTSTAVVVEQEETTAEHPTPARRGKLSLRANLLRWATLTPDLGLEWQFLPCWSIQLNGSWTSWSWDNKNRRYALWNVSPEMRYYMGKEKRGYLGAMYHTGEFNYKFSNTGKQGCYQGGGLTGGYLLRLNRCLNLDFHAGVGYSRAEYDKYVVTKGIRVRRGNGTKNYWGINQIGVTLVWKITK